MQVVPGEVSHWLRRATLQELQEAKRQEKAKPQRSIIWPFVIAIDEELAKRDQR